MPRKLSEDEFLKTFEKAPRIAFSLLIENQNKEILLTKRLISPEKNMWHYPGSFLLKDETIEGCLKRVAKNELGYNLKEKTYLIGVFENLNKDPRGHVIDVIYKLKTTNKKQLFLPTEETKEIRFFKILPKQMGFNHRNSLKYLGYK